MDATTFVDLVSGRLAGPLPGAARSVLRALSCGYASAVRLRNVTYDRGWKPTHRVDVPVISVGNVTTGGTGKTPVVAWIANWLHDRGHRTGILSRGYGADASGSNDEDRVLSQLCPDAIRKQDPNRVRGARELIEQGCDVIVLDDGFQHRRLHRDLNVVLVDAVAPWGFGHVLPRGLLREPLSGLRRADVVILTRADQVHDNTCAQRHVEIARWTTSATSMAECVFAADSLRSNDGRAIAPEELAGQRVGVFCGIGNPPAFVDQLSALGFRVDWSRTFPDHHLYSGDDLRALAERAERTGVDAVITTRKDIVKIEEAALGNCPLWFLDIRADFRESALELEHRLVDLMGSAIEQRRRAG